MPKKKSVSNSKSPHAELIIEGARQNNLKNISLRIPHNAVTVITGVSGSGKSSLAFDTLFAEGQWRYVESLSSYTRMFLDRVKRPDVDRLANIRPSIALEQKNPIRTSRSTVGTTSEVSDYFLFDAASPYYGGYSRGPYRTGGFYRNTPRSRSYRGVESRRSSSQRPRRSMENGTSNPPPAASSSKSSGSRFRRLRRSGRRH